MSKALVAYFSATGTTEDVARALAQAAGADTFRIEPAVPYTSADLDWRNKKSRSSLEMADAKSRPEIREAAPNLDAYDVVFVGFPIWWYVAPTIVNAFLESGDFSGKKIVPFATSGGSGMGGTVAALKLSAPNAEFAAGKVLNGASKPALEKFVQNNMA